MKNGLWLLLFSLLLPPAALLAADAPGSPSVADRRELRVTEPVFGGEVHILEAGRGKPVGVLLVHGLGELAGRTWEMLIPELAGDYHVVAVDLPGFGRSEKRNVLYSPARYAAFLKWVVDRYAPGPLVVVGHSLGGAVALRYAADYPRDVQKLILVDVAGILHRKVYTREVAGGRLQERLTRLSETPLRGLDEAIADLLYKVPELPLDLDLVLENDLLRGQVLGGNPARIAALALAQEDFSATLRQVRAPAVILWGADDLVTPLRTGILLEAVLPSARLLTIPQAGHVPMFDQPALFNRTLLDAIGGIAPPVPAPPPAGGTVGTCRGEEGKTFTGAFERLEIADCRDVRLVNVTCGPVTITRSEVEIEKGMIAGEVALTVTDSEVKATGLRIRGGRAVLCARSRLDLAGVDLEGESAAVEALGRATLYFSVSRIKSPLNRGFRHGVQTLGAGDRL